MTHFADLHSHSTASDGAHPPAEVVAPALRAGLRALALPAHAALSGVAGALEAAERSGLELIPGVEISAADEADKGRYGLHILGLFIDPRERGIVDFLDAQARARVEQKRVQVRRFQELGFEISEEALFARVTGVPGKPHLVAALLELNPERGLTERDIYNDYLGPKGPARVEREGEPPAAECIEVIHRAGGVALLAHPLYQSTDGVEALVDGLLADGLDGIEIDCPYEENDEFRQVAGGRPEILAPLLRLAERRPLLVSGGSDYHGNHIGGALGSAGVDRAQVERLREAASRIAARA